MAVILATNVTPSPSLRVLMCHKSSVLPPSHFLESLIDMFVDTCKGLSSAKKCQPIIEGIREKRLTMEETHPVTGSFDINGRAFIINYFPEKSLMVH